MTEPPGLLWSLAESMLFGEVVLTKWILLVVVTSSLFGEVVRLSSTPRGVRKTKTPVAGRFGWMSPQLAERKELQWLNLVEASPAREVELARCQR